MTDSVYIARLQEHLTNYKSSVLLVQESGFWGNRRAPIPTFCRRHDVSSTS